MKEPEYEVNEEVEVRGWTGTVSGVILGVERMYHPMAYDYCWGYRIDFGTEKNPFTFASIPEGYLGKIEVKK